MHNDEIHPGDVIAGKYRVRAILGRGHGLLVEAFHTEFDQRVVIKLILPGYGDDREIERVRREARILAKLESEHVARIIDVGTEEDGSFYLVRQYLDGIDLASWLRQLRGPLPLVDAVLIILMVAEAIAETHSHGVIIREMQPAHLFLTQRPGGAPLVRISDFGTAKLMREAAAPGVGGDLTATAMFGLSPYSSPELVRKARNVDARTDVWSLGAVLYELLTGRPPFVGEAAFLMLQITKEEPAPVSSLRADVPAEIDQILGWAMAKDVDARFKNVHSFAHALAPYASPEGQMLIERIGQITEAAKVRKRGGSVPPPAPSFPSSRPGPMQAPASHRPPAPAAQQAYAPPPPRAPHISEDVITGVRGAVSPGSQPPPPPGSRRGIPPPPDGQPVGNQWATSSPGTTAPATQMPSMPPANDEAARSMRKVVFGAIAVSAVLLPLVILLLVLRKKPATEEGTQASATTQATASAQASATAPAETAPAATETAQPQAAPPPETATAAPEPPPSAEPAANNADAPKPKKSEKKGAAAPPPPAPRVEPSPSGGGSGTLLALAVGGSCAFSVNGAGKGTSSSLRLSLKPGTYSVTCRPPSGATKSKSVSVKAGETAMATFKL